MIQYRTHFSAHLIPTWVPHSNVGWVIHFIFSYYAVWMHLLILLLLLLLLSSNAKIDSVLNSWWFNRLNHCWNFLNHMFDWGRFLSGYKSPHWNIFHLPVTQTWNKASLVKLVIQWPPEHSPCGSERMILSHDTHWLSGICREYPQSFPSVICIRVKQCVTIRTSCLSVVTSFYQSQLLMVIWLIYRGVIMLLTNRALQMRKWWLVRQWSIRVSLTPQSE